MGAIVLAFALLCGSGCARRLTLTPSEFERIEEREQATEDLRVYVSKRLILVYEREDDAATYEVDKAIKTSSEQSLLRVIIAKNTKGLILGTEDQNGAPLLWVTFDSRCRDKACAIGFVQTEDGVFRLHSIPARDGYQPANVHFKRESKPMSLGKLASLAEKNDVWAWKNWRDKTFTIDLTVKKRTDTKQRVETERGTGVD